MQWGMRVGFYVIGLFFMALGVAFSVNSNLGISPVNALPYVVSEVTGAELGSCVIAVFCSYIAMQAAILRREFHPVNLLQIVFSTVFGSFVDFAKMLLGSFSLPTYAGQLAMLVISILLVSVGILLYIEVDLVPMPMEGLSQSLSRKLGIPFHNMKIIIDCIVVAVSIALSLICLHRLVGIREGTILTAVAVGKVIALLKKPLSPILQRLCFDNIEEAPHKEIEQDAAADGASDLPDS